LIKTNGSFEGFEGIHYTSVKVWEKIRRINEIGSGLACAFVATFFGLQTSQARWKLCLLSAAVAFLIVVSMLLLDWIRPLESLEATHRN
jgi:energy-converting hydrogenase Eha subunit G